MHFRQWIEYTTKSTKNSYPIEVGIKKVDYSDIFVQSSEVRNLCKKGCKNYSRQGGCPPFAPIFTDIVSQANSIFLVYGRFYPQFKTEKVKNSKSPYIHYTLQDQVLSNLLYSIGISLRNDHRCIFLGTGYCMGCKGRKCNFRNNITNCANPNKRTYSLEATGVNVSLTLQRVFDITLKWYGNNKPLDITLTKCAAFVFNTDISEKDFINIFLTYVNPLGEECTYK